MRNKAVRFLVTAGLCLSMMAMTGCVDQSSTDTDSTVQGESIETLLEISDPVEKAAVEAAKAKVASMSEETRIIATSAATADICDKLNLDLVGVCKTTTSSVPERYQELETVGSPMSPDMKIVASLNPDWVLSPSSLQADLQPKYEASDTEWAFLNLRSVPGMYRSIQELGEIFDREEEAQTLVDEFVTFYNEYKEKNEGKESPKVLVLMGLPGSYIIATENSYVGSLVDLAGGENVCAGTDQVAEMFKKDFEENDIWKYFEAVQNDKVYYLTYELFGMSATFRYPEALDELQPILYPESEADEAAAKANSEQAQKDAQNSDASEKYEESQNDD